MRRTVSGSSVWGRPGPSMGLALALGWVGLSLAAAEVRAATAPTDAVPAVTLSDAFQSVFIDDPKFGKDPFFPKSTRRRAAVSAAVQPQATPAPNTALRVRGLSVANGRRLVIINTVTFAEGDEATVKLNNQSWRVKCLRIGDDSVLVHVNGVPTELPVALR